jgi:hypothetical protein
MNRQQTLIVMRMLRDRRLPLEQSEVFSEAILDALPGHPLDLTEERLQALSRYLPDLVVEYRKAGGAASTQPLDRPT